MVTPGKHGMAGFSRGAHKTVWSSTLVAVFGLYLATAASASDWQLLSKTDTNRVLHDIWGTSPNDMFLVGQHGTFMRGGGSSWLDVANNPKATDPYAVYTTLWGTSSSNIYIGGGYWNGPQNLEGFLLHYDGSAVSVVADNLPNHILSVSGTGTNDIWAAGGYWDTPLAMHYDGSSWAQQTWGSTKPGEITSVWGTSSTNTYAICGDSSPKGQIWHYNGSSWQQQTSTGTIGYKVWGTDANNVFAVGNMSPTVKHYNGTTWESLNCGTSAHLFEVGGAGPRDVFVGGENGVVRKYDGATWTAMPSGAAGHIQGFSSPNSSTLFAVSDTGEVLKYVAAPRQTLVLSVGVSGYADGLRGDVAAERVKNAFDAYGSVKTNWLLPLDYNENDFTKNNDYIKSYINTMRGKVSPGDTFILYLSGHGSWEKSGKELEVQAQNNSKDYSSREATTGNECFATTWEWNHGLSDDSLSGVFGSDSGSGWQEDPLWKQVNKLLIVDCCFSGGFTGSSSNGDTGDLSRLSKVALISSATEWNFGFWRREEGTGLGLSDFSVALVAALKALQDEQHMTVEQLFDEIQLRGSMMFEKDSLGYITSWDENWGVSCPTTFSAYQVSAGDFDLTLGIPEPATLSLLALGGLAAMARRKRN